MLDSEAGLVVAVNDIVDFGSDRKPRWPGWRRRLLVCAACAMVALTAAFFWYLPGSHHHGGGQATPTALSPSPTAQEVVNPPPSPLPAKPALMTGRALPRGGARLLLGGQRPAWLQVPGGQTEPIGGLPGRGTSYQFIRVASGWTVQPFPPATDGCGNCAPAPLPVYYLADGAAAARRIGSADLTAPAAAPGALWLVSYRPGADMSSTAGAAQEVSSTGAALGPRLRLPTGYVIDQGTRAGLLLVQEQPGSGPVRYELWNPGTRRVTRSLVNVIAASPTQLAWLPACTDNCLVHVLEPPGGQTGEIALPRRSTSAEGAFSPDGRLLALQVGNGVTADGRTTTNQLMVAATPSGRIAAVPGTTVGGGVGMNFGWQPGSGQLIAEVSVDTQGQPEWQIGVWQPGAATLSTALARVPSESWPVVNQGPD
jgi:hypothetical protein